MAEQNFRPFVTPENKRKPMNQKYAGFEIEKRFVLRTLTEDYTKNNNALDIYNEVLEKGLQINQGYFSDMTKAKKMLDELGIILVDEFRPNTVRLRKFGKKYILTLKDKKETKTREVEWKLTASEFKKWWPETKDLRVYKKRMEKTRKGFTIEFDAYTDRFLLKAEIEVAEEKDLKKCPALGLDVTNDKTWSNKALARCEAE